MATAIVFPGQTLGLSTDYSPGPGTHIHNGHICASTLGHLTKQTAPPKQPLKPATQPAPSLPKLSITPTPPQATATPSQNLLPTVNTLVLARVTRINPRHATLSILVVDQTICAEGFQGLVRAQDVRATEKDKVRISESFRPGDIVRAQVISIGDQANYYLSTASNELGVVVATSEAGNAMYPVSWREFRDAVTGVGESRKVAKPV